MNIISANDLLVRKEKQTTRRQDKIVYFDNYHVYISIQCALITAIRLHAIYCRINTYE